MTLLSVDQAMFLLRSPIFTSVLLYKYAILNESTHYDPLQSTLCRYKVIIAICLHYCTAITVSLAYHDSIVAACCLQVRNNVTVTEGMFP